MCLNFGFCWVRDVDQTTRLPRVIGCLQTPGAGLRFAIRGFFPAKKLSVNLIMGIYWKMRVCICFSKCWKRTPGQYPQNPICKSNGQIQQANPIGTNRQYNRQYNRQFKKMPLEKRYFMKQQISFKKVRGTPRTLLDLPRHCLDHPLVFRISKNKCS